MWGYLFPSIHTIDKLNAPESSQYLFRSCGPVMDKLTKEVMQLFNYNFNIIPNNSVENNDCCSLVTLPRWDIFLLQPHLLSQDTPECSHTISLREELNKHTNILNVLKQKNFTSELSLAISKVKSRMEKKLNMFENTTDFKAFSGCYILIARSSEPEFYAKGGKAETKGYGISRRALVGIEDIEQKLRNRDIPVRIFEPGQFSLMEQIRVFQCCKGIIGIKGAEFANLIWLKPKSKVILIKPANMVTPPVQKYLAKNMDLEYIEIENDQGPFPKLEPETIEKYLV